MRLAQPSTLVRIPTDETKFAERNRVDYKQWCQSLDVKVHPKSKMQEMLHAFKLFNHTLRKKRCKHVDGDLVVDDDGLILKEDLSYVACCWCYGVCRCCCRYLETLFTGSMLTVQLWSHLFLFVCSFGFGLLHRRIMQRMGMGLESDEHAAFMEVACSPLFAQAGEDGQEYVNYVKLIKHLN